MMGFGEKADSPKNPTQGPIRREAETLIIGAGIMGLAIAYNLAKRGVKNVLVVDRSYLCGGASGRNGGGVRAQWSSEANIRLMQESIRLCQEFAGEMKINVWFRQGGYLFLVRSEAKRACREKVGLRRKWPTTDIGPPSPLPTTVMVGHGPTNHRAAVSVGRDGPISAFSGATKLFGSRALSRLQIVAAKRRRLLVWVPCLEFFIAASLLPDTRAPWAP